MNQNNSSNRRERGFTLIEILLAVVILGIILVTVYGSLSRTINSKDTAEERAELYASGREAVLKMASEIETAITPLSGDRVYFRGTAGPAPTIEFIAMNRGGYGLNRVRPGRVLIAYTLDPVPKRRGIFALRREEHLFAALLAEADGIEPVVDEEDEEDPAPKAIATYLLDCPDMPNEIDLPGSCIRIVGLTFRYFDQALGQWTDAWDSTVEDTAMYRRLPSAVEISLVLADDDGGQFTSDFSTIVDLPLSEGQPTPSIGGGSPAQDDNADDDGEADLEDEPGDE